MTNTFEVTFYEESLCVLRRKESVFMWEKIRWWQEVRTRGYNTELVVGVKKKEEGGCKGRVIR